jgi:hypothetical protein
VVRVKLVLFAGRAALGYGQEEELWVVLEEDGTEVSQIITIDLHPGFHEF